MNKIMNNTIAVVLLLMTALLVLGDVPAEATIQGLTGTNFTFVAKQDNISTSDGDSILMWGYANGDGNPMQYPGPTLIVNKGDTITITLKNMLPAGHGQKVSIVFPGHAATASGGDAGLLTREAPPDGATTVTYSFTATNPGTYMYHSGTNMDLQIEMGLVGAIIVRSGMAPQDTLVTPGYTHPLTSYAYDHAGTAYEREYLFLLTEMVPDIHRLVEFGELNKIDTSDYFAKSWFINGRNAMDVMAEPDVSWLPTQPYNSMPMMHPGEKVLARVIGGGRDLHPFHFHGNDVRVIARDGRLLSSAPGAGPDLAYNDFTVMSVPGQTYDAIFQWTGKDLGWDAYGHAAGDALQPYEWAPDHGKPLPVTLPPVSAMALGDLWSGSPFLGATGELPPGHPGLNMAGGYNYMWHSHSEKEMTTNNIFPGGMMTMMMVVPWGAPIP